MTEDMHLITPLTSPNPSGTNSVKSNKSGNQLTKAITLNHVPKSFYNSLKMHDFSDIEILSIYDSKILEAGMIYWLKVKKNETPYGNEETSPNQKQI